MCGFDGIRKGTYFRGETIGRAEAEVRVGSSGMERPQVGMRSLDK